MKVAVAGGGITGLACAHYLRSAGIDAVVFDPTPGGLIGSVDLEGCRLETGPESWLASKPWLEELIRELGLGDEMIGSNDPMRKTYIVRDGRFVTLPEGLQMVVPTKLRPILETTLFSWNSKARMAAEVLRNPQTLPDRSVRAFVADHFGEEAVDYLAEPLLAGVYGGSPDELSAPSVLPKFVEYEQRYGSVIVGALREKKKTGTESIFKSMRRGMGTVTDALRANLDIVPERVEALRPSVANQENSWQVYAGGVWHNFDSVVLCCGANAAAPLVSGIDEAAGNLLASIPYTGSSIWTLGYRKEDVAFPLNGFGFLVPKKERRTIMACTWVATKWLGRIPEDKAVLRCFQSDPDASLEAVREDLQRLMQIDRAPAFTMYHRLADTMPQYTVGHTARVGELEHRIAQIPGLYLAGNSYHGIGLPDCVRSARRAAEAIADTGR